MASTPPEPTGLRRLVAAWQNLAREQRMVVAAALALLGTMALPWYSRSVDAIVRGQLQATSSTKLAITVFSLVEAAIFLVALGVSVLVLARGDRRAFHLPGGDGTVVTVAGAWATFLIFYRFVDKPTGGGGNQVRVEYGLSWGIFFGLLAALALVAAGLRLRAAHATEPALPGSTAPSDGPAGAPAAAVDVAAAPTPVAATPDAFEDGTRAARRREREERRGAGRVSAETPVRERRPATALPEATPRDEAPTHQAPAEESPTRHVAADEAPTRLFEP